MTGKDVETFQANVRRCLESSTFIQDFYDRFNGTSDAIRDKFKNAVAVQGGPDHLARFDMKRLYTKHQHTGIRPEMYQTWLDCFIETARTHDPEFAPGVERAWRECLSPGIVAMRNRPRSPRVHLSQLFRNRGHF